MSSPGLSRLLDIRRRESGNRDDALLRSPVGGDRSSDRLAALRGIVQRSATPSKSAGYDRDVSDFVRPSSERRRPRIDAFGSDDDDFGDRHRRGDLERATPRRFHGSGSSTTSVDPTRLLEEARRRDTVAHEDRRWKDADRDAHARIDRLKQIARR